MSREGTPPVAAESVSFYSSPPIEFDLPLSSEYKKPEDECGVFGVWAPGQDVLSLTVAGMRGLQHRGHSGAGIAYELHNIDLVDPNEAHINIIHKGHGRVEDAIPELTTVDLRKGGFSLRRFEDLVGTPVAVGHTRYSTSDSEQIDAIQPLFPEGSAFAAGINGNSDNVSEVAFKRGLDVTGAASDSDEIISLLGHQMKKLGSLEAALHDVLPELDGAFCITIMHEGRLIAARDAFGFHPLALGKLPDDRGYIVSSEEVVLAEVGAEFVRDIEPGEVLVIDESGLHSSKINRQEDPLLCAFEGIYTAREDGIVDGIDVRQMRYNLGYYLGKDMPANADIVVAIPASGVPSAKGYAAATGLPLVAAIEKKLGAPRTFQMRGESRARAIADKYLLYPDLISGKNVVLDDDSMIKGHTMKALVRIVKEAGASSVHVRLSSAHYRKACLMGMDTHDESRLVASRMSDEQIAEYVGADSVGFNTPERVQQAGDEARVRPAAGKSAGKMCMSCVTGKYPFAVTDTNGNTVFPQKSLPVLTCAGSAALTGVQA